MEEEETAADEVVDAVAGNFYPQHMLSVYGLADIWRTGSAVALTDIAKFRAW